MYTLRKISYSDKMEVRENKNLGEKGYFVYYKINSSDQSELLNNEFKNMCDNYFIDQTQDYSKIAGFVIGENDSINPFFTDQAVFIVNNEGKTIERVFGQVKKY